MGQLPNHVVARAAVPDLEARLFATTAECSRPRARLPEGYRRDHGRYAANLAIPAAHDGQVDRAVAAGHESLAIAIETGSAHTVADLRRMRRALVAWEDSAAVRKFDESLVNVSA